MGKLKIDGITVEFNIPKGKGTRVSSGKMRKDNCDFEVGQVYRVGALGENKFVADETESATAKCSPNDEFNEWIGKRVAVCRLLDEPIPMFITGE